MVSFESGVLRTPPFLALNPRGKVPIFVDGEVVMHESLAILHYIESRFPEVGTSVEPSSGVFYA